MRLQVSILRHGLPTTNILFTPRSLGPLPATFTTNATIAQLLEDINDVVPLESTDWGLEDYIVDINGYECLHFHPIHSVLRDNDQITIRSLKTEDLRLRRLGGRHQISHDGRHLIDGVAFGKPWLRKGGRPPVEIPPRKRRKLEVDCDTADVTNKAPSSPKNRQNAMGALIELPQVEESIAIDHADRDLADDDEQLLQIEASPDLQHTLQQNGIASDQGNEMLAELIDLLDEDRSLAAKFADFLGNPDKHERPQDYLGTPHPRKRKRAADNEDNLEDDETEFKGFSSPAWQDSDDSDEDWEINSTYKSTSCSKSDSDESEAVDSSSISQVMGLQENSDPDEEFFDNESETTSSDSSEAKSDSSIEDEESSSPSGSFEEASDVANGFPSKQMKSNLFDDSSKRHFTEFSILQPSPAGALPGRGSNRTHYGNKRIQKRRELVRLKERGLLPENANFADMDALKESSLPELNCRDLSVKEMNVPELEVLPNSFRHANDRNENYEDAKFGDSLEVNKAKLLAQISGTSLDQINPTNYEKSSQPVILGACTPAMPLANGIVHSSPSMKEFKSKSSKKRSRLDLASSRNLIFGSLGVRTPKTPEAEQALREKFARSNQGPRKSQIPLALPSYDIPIQAPEFSSNETWQSKLIVSAVECEAEGVKLSAPPFPFKQFWHGGAMRDPLEKVEVSYNTHYNDDDDCYAGHGTEGRKLPVHDKEHIAQLFDEFPRPDKFEVLASLDHHAATPGAVIAYKELIMPEDTFQPEVSVYRVARVQAIQDDGRLELLISAHDRKRRRSAQYDKETGERMWRKFEVPDEDVIEDSGNRTMSFQDLIDPKILQISELSKQSNQNNRNTATHVTQTDTVVEASTTTENTALPTSTEIQRNPTVFTLSELDVSSQRRTEISAIIKEAGFDSTLDPEVLPPVNGLNELRTPSAPARGILLAAARDNLAGPPERSQSSGPNTSRFSSPQVNGDSSSPALVSQDTNDPKDSGEIVETTDGDRSGVQQQLEHVNVVYPNLPQLDGAGFLSTDQMLLNENESRRSQVAFEPFALVSDWRSDPEDEANELDSESKIDQGAKQNEVDDPAYEVDRENELNGVSNSENNIYHENEFNNIHVSTDEPDLDRLGSVVQPSSNEQFALSSSPQPDESSFLSGRDGRDSLNEEELPSILETTSTARSIRVSAPHLRNLWKGKVNPRRKSAAASLTPTDQSSQPKIKLSQSQGRWSQIPEGSQIVDLTMSSEPMSPRSTDNDHLSPNRRTRKSQRKMKKTTTKEEVLAMNSGLGNRRLLKSKKTKASS